MNQTGDMSSEAARIAEWNNLTEQIDDFENHEEHDEARALKIRRFNISNEDQKIKLLAKYASRIQQRHGEGHEGEVMLGAVEDSAFGLRLKSEEKEDIQGRIKEEILDKNSWIVEDHVEDLD